MQFHFSYTWLCIHASINCKCVVYYLININTSLFHCKDGDYIILPELGTDLTNRWIVLQHKKLQIAKM